MRVPAFQYPGGKARLREWLLGSFPGAGRIYREPFAGRGNVFFAARRRLKFEIWEVNDLHTAPFFTALASIDPAALPEAIDRTAFEALRADPGSAVSLAVEPRVTFFGKGWYAGFKTSSDGPSPSGRVTVGYSGKYYKPLVAEAKRLLAGAHISQLDWIDMDWGCLGPDDFVYLDPPYLGTSDAYYGQIDHPTLVALLLAARFRWALSGYESELYMRAFGPPQFRRERAAEMTGRTGEKRVECLWISGGAGSSAGRDLGHGT